MDQIATIQFIRKEGIKSQLLVKKNFPYRSQFIILNMATCTTYIMQVDWT